jgi:predicted CXXCH cytochrome family protein
MQAGHAHPPATRDCARCHAPHHSDQVALLVQAQAALCADCHDVRGQPFASAHLGIDASAMDCVRCHDPHASKDPKLFRDALHAPFEGRACEECHVVPGK